MRLPSLRQAAPEICATARAQRWDPAEMLRVLLAEEVAGRDRATRELRRCRAGLPNGKTFDSFDPARSTIPRPTQRALRTLEWVGRAENLAICGPSGTGKSHLTEAIAHAVIDAGMRVAWFSLESLTDTVGRAKVDASVTKVVARICRAERRCARPRTPRSSNIRAGCDRRRQEMISTTDGQHRSPRVEEAPTHPKKNHICCRQAPASRTSRGHRGPLAAPGGRHGRQGGGAAQPVAAG
ncbi:MAG: ATP-binding protein [Actinomycetota bacterium]|nr:ATP-binding protein [Actinomycetota bacterium]